MAKHLLINLETKAITGVDTDIVSYSIVSCDETGPKTAIQGLGFNPTKLNKEERKSFKEAANKLIDIHDRQTLDEEVKEYENFYRGAMNFKPLGVAYHELEEIYGPNFTIADMYPKTLYVRKGERGGCKVNYLSHYCKADVDLTLPALKLSKPSLDKIYINPDKEIVTAKKDNGDIIKVQNSQGDEFDPYIGAALAYCYKQFGSKAAFRKAVDKITPKPKKKKKVTVTETVYAGNKPVLTHEQFHAEYDIIKQDKYEVGDRVKIVSDLSEGHDYDIYCNGTMASCAGNVCEITEVIPRENYIEYTLNNDMWSWTEDMLEGKVVPKK